MFPQWVSIPRHWNLQDVQAAINIVIDVLCALGIFIFVRVCWQRAAERIARREHVPLPALLSVSTPGDAVDVLILLKRRLLSRQFLAILAQCLVVVSLSALAIVSGPLARYSCRASFTDRVDYVPGSLASRKISSIYAFNVEWSQACDQLKKAGFPTDQLLDFMPDTHVDWIYREGEWNNSWSLTCTKTLETPLSLRVSNKCSDLPTYIPGLRRAFDPQGWDYYNWDITDFLADNIEKNVLLFVYGVRYRSSSQADSTYHKLDISIAQVLMEDMKANLSDTTGGCEYATGPVGRAAFTRVDCVVSRRKHVTSASNVAFPDVVGPDSDYLTTAFGLSQNSQLIQRSIAGLPVKLLTPDELIRFYQSYLIVKDTLSKQPVIRPITINDPVVQISTIFLAIACCFTFLVLLGGCGLLVFSLRHRHVTRSTPQTKLDWMMQSIQNKGRSPFDSKGRPRWSVSTDPDIALSPMRSTKRRRSEFSIAKYGRSSSSGAIPQYFSLSPQPSRDSIPYHGGFHSSPTPLTRFPSQSLRSTPSFSSDQYDSRPYMGLGIEEDEQSLVRPY